MFNCPKCSKSFISNRDLKRHLERTNPCDIIKNFICDICLYVYASKQALQIHKNNPNACKKNITKKLLQQSIINNTVNNNSIQNNTINNITNNQKGIIYLIQPTELLGTNRYKFGCSTKLDFSRLKSYKVGSRYIYTYECINPFKLEKYIINILKLQFLLIAGHEYFEVDNEIEIKITICNCILQYEKENLKN